MLVLDAASTRRLTTRNMTMMQAFEWYVPADQQHWKRLASQVSQLKRFGIDNLWIPPACKASSPSSNGYDIYDLYDLGEFDQKGGVETKWGSKEDLLALVKHASEHGIGLYFDAVLNHKAGADHTEKCLVQEVDGDDRTNSISEPYEIDAWLGFDFLERAEKYSKQKYHWYHFSGTDFNVDNSKTAIYQILGESSGWAAYGDVDSEKGNYDYLMFADLDYSHPEVEKDVINWGVWMAKEVAIQGIRFDAVKHFSENFLRKFIANFDKVLGSGCFFVGEFWKDSLRDMIKYLERMDRKFSLFDAPLVYNFSRISKSENGDLTKVFENTLVMAEPVNAVTLVMNHDTQPYQALEIAIEPFLKPLAYALILLRYDGYPCLFYGDLYGIDPGGEKQQFGPSCDGRLASLALTRKLYAYGEQKDYFDYRTCIGWVRFGTWDRPSGCAIVMSNAGPGEKRMSVDKIHAGERWTDVLHWEHSEVEIDVEGFGLFLCSGTSVSVWVNKDAEGRDQFGNFDAQIY